MDAPTDRRVHARQRGENLSYTDFTLPAWASCALYFDMGFSRPSREYKYNAHALFMRCRAPAICYGFGSIFRSSTVPGVIRTSHASAENRPRQLAG